MSLRQVLPFPAGTEPSHSRPTRARRLRRAEGRGQSGGGAGRGVSGRGRPLSGCSRRRAGPHGGAAGAALLHELPSSRGGPHFRVGPRGVRRPRRGPGGPQVSRGGRLPGPARAEDPGAGWAAGPGGSGAPRGRAGSRRYHGRPGLQARASGRFGGPRAAGRPWRGFLVSQPLPLSSRIAGEVRIPRAAFLKVGSAGGLPTPPQTF